MFNKAQPAYIDLRNIISERTKSVVAWVGAGLSQPAGLPSWGTLRTMLNGEVEQRINQYNKTDPMADQVRGRLKVAKEQANPWVAIQILRELLGTTSFAAAIRRAFVPADTCEIPTTYRKLWDLRIAGMLTLNIDRLATRSWNAKNHGIVIPEFSGQRAGDNAHILRSGKPFIANLHGLSSEEPSWVFTQDTLSPLLDDEGYKAFIGTVALSKTILFVGISADDIAAGGHLQRLKELKIDFGSHYWLTHRADYQTFQWAERSGIQLISYDSRNDHSELLEVFDDLQTFIPCDEPAAPIALGAPGMPLALPPPAELAARPAEDIRSLLNATASQILLERPDEYSAFYAQYDEAIYRAWYVGPRPSGQTILGYKLDHELARGAFGRVFKALSPDSNPVALKLLHEEVRHTPERLDAFRRGVRAMQILSARGVRGMVPYRAASEIPAFAVMELINGPNLTEAMANGVLNDWGTILRIAVSISSIIKEAHSLPERILHRDIRPPNIMLKNYYADHENWEVVILDFDLSWHRDALGRSVAAETLHGYLAPEQVSEVRGSTTRSALVDSFGVGMTLYFLATHEDPVFAQHLHKDWEPGLVAKVRERGGPSWKSLPRRFARLIVQATRDNQSSRIDIARIEGELRNLLQAEQSPLQVESAELLAEELAARSGIGEYSWNPDLLEAEIGLASGLQVHIRAEEVDDEVSVRLTWQDFGAHEKKRVSKWLPAAGQRAHSKLQKSGWASDLSIESMGLTISATAGLSNLKTTLNSLSAGLGGAAEELRFD
jgi:serine/threonine protein kinase